MSNLKPLAYGYLRLSPDIDDETVRLVELKLKAHAEALGYEFATYFYEDGSGCFSAWNELLTEVQRADAHHVIVPSLDHLTTHPILRLSLLDRAQQDAKVEVHELSDE
jgi:DNA invertase Pin-like site-specific DNA recombinase